jgi:hypothetical protein
MDAADATRTRAMCRRGDSRRFFAFRQHIVVIANAVRKALSIEPFTIPKAP